MIGLRDYFGFDFTANRKKIILEKDLRKYAVMKELTGVSKIYKTACYLTT